MNGPRTERQGSVHEAAATFGRLDAVVANVGSGTARHGWDVRVNAVAPGNVLFPGGAWERKLAERREGLEHDIQSEVPLRRSFITGACLVVDGGQTRSFA